MAAIVSPPPDKNLFNRIMGPLGNRLSVSAAKSLLRLDFTEWDHARIAELSPKNKQDSLTASEQEEFDEYERMGSFLDLLHSKARLSLKRRAAS